MQGPEHAPPRAATAGLVSWSGANFAPLVLIPLAALFVWVAIWQVWLPRPGGGPAVSRTVTTIDADSSSKPAHKTTTVVKTVAPASQSRRSETLVIALLFLGAGAALIGVFHERIGSIELDKDGLKITLTKAEQSGAAVLIDRLARNGAGSRAYGRGLRRYVTAVAAERPVPAGGTLAAAAPPGLSSARANALAERIADALL